jgi:ribosomal-protein-alanine N-acetyltransferase
MMDVTTRRFKEGDYDSVCSLNEMRVAGGYHGHVFIRQAAVLFPQTFLVAERGEDIIGFVIGAHEQEKPVNAWILRLGVRETCRRKKVGERLLMDLIGIFRVQHVKGIYLSVSPENTPAIRLYEKHGFHIIDNLDGYFGQDEPRCIMRLILP